MSIDRIARRPTVVITPMVTAAAHIPRPDDPGEAVRYQRQRLAVGVVGIGLLVVGTPLLATTDAARSAARDLSVGPAPVGGALVAAALAVLASLILLPVDWAGGVAVERRFGMGGDGWWRSFLPGVAGWVAACAAGGFLVGAATLAGGAWWAVAAGLVTVAMPVAAVLTDAAARRSAVPATAAEQEALAASLRPLGVTAPVIAFTRGEERAVDGGWAGRTLLLSASCRPLVGSDVLACLVVRELGHRRRRDRARGIAAGTAWAAAAAPLTALVWSPAAGDTGVVVLTMAATATVWSWIGLLVLPTLGRRQVLAADRAWMEAGGSTETLRRTIRFLADRNLGNPTLPVWVERIFHPVPSVATRLAAIDAREAR